MHTAFIFGCSHAAGDEMFGYKTDLEYTHSFPALIAHDLGYDICNHAIPGGSNDAIFRAFSDLVEDIGPKDIVMFCWTGPYRAEIYSEWDNQWLQFALGRSVFHKTEANPVARQGRFIKHLVKDADGWRCFLEQWTRRYLDSKERNARMNQRRNVIAANSLAHHLGITAINLRSFGDWPPVEWRLVNHWSWPLQQTTFVKWSQNHGFQSTKNGHFMLDAHKAFADYAVPHIILPQ